MAKSILTSNMATLPEKPIPAYNSYLVTHIQATLWPIFYALFKLKFLPDNLALLALGIFLKRI